MCNFVAVQIYHPNIVQTHEIITINQKVFIALEWAGRGDLLGYVRLKGAIKEPESARLFNEMCLALDYLHGKNIVHRNGPYYFFFNEESVNSIIWAFG